MMGIKQGGILPGGVPRERSLPLPHARAPRSSAHACAQHCPLGATVSSSPIREQVELAGTGDAFVGVDRLLHDEHIHLLAAHLDRLGAQGLLAAADMEGGEVDAQQGLPCLTLAVSSTLLPHSLLVSDKHPLTVQTLRHQRI